MRVLVLYCPSFAVDVERMWLGLPVGHPIVIGGPATGPGVVAAACRRAQARGVRVGQPLVEAASRCPEAHFAPGVLDRYAEAASRLDEEIRTLCRAVAWRSIDEAVVLESDLAPGAGGLAAVADTLRTHIEQRLGLSLAAGIADGEIAASLAARLVAPAGLLQVLPGYDARVIAPLPVGWLPEVPASAVQRLAARGIDTLGALATLDPAQAVKMLGARAGEWQLAAAGVKAAATAPTHLPRSLTRAMSTPAVVSLDDARVAAEAVSEAVAERLLALGLSARTLTVRVVGEDGRFRSRTLTLPEAASTREALGPVVRTLIAALWRYGNVPRRVSVVATGLTAEGPQLRLFGDEVVSPRVPAGTSLRSWRTRESFKALATRRMASRPRAS